MRALFAAGLAACLSLSAPALAGGAIAVDDHDIKFGHSFAGSPTEAAKEAMKKCANANCKVMIKFTDKCGAFAASKRSYGVGAGATKASASAAALDNCGGGDCAVAMAECE